MQIALQFHIIMCIVIDMFSKQHNTCMLVQGYAVSNTLAKPPKSFSIHLAGLMKRAYGYWRTLKDFKVWSLMYACQTGNRSVAV